MKIIAVIQARLNSTRLPRKILLPLAGKSMLQNVVERVSRAKTIDNCVIALARTEMLLEDVRSLVSDGCPPNIINFPIVDENDLIGRLLGVARIYKADAVIRVCADNPCVEAEEIDKLVITARGWLFGERRRLFLNSEDIENNHDGFGGEFYSLEMLEHMDRTITDAGFREHPHRFWFSLGLDFYVGKSYPPGFRLDVNTQEDYEKVKRIYDHFGHNRFTVKEAMGFLGGSELVTELMRRNQPLFSNVD